MSIKIAKQVREILGLELEFSTAGASCNRDGDFMRVKMLDELIDTREGLDVWPEKVLSDVTSSEIRIEGEGNAGEECEEVGRSVLFGLSGG
jgi:hypothetical protein